MVYIKYSAFQGLIIVNKILISQYNFHLNRKAIIVLVCFIGILNPSYWELNVWLNINIYKCLISNKINMSIFHRLEVVGCGNETQIQVGENLNHLKRHNQAKIIKKSVILFLAS